MPQITDPLRAYEERKRTREPFAVRPGYEIRVHTRLKEGEKERTQVFEGIVTAITGQGLGKTFTVRRLAAGIGVERIFPMFSPLITNVDIVRATKVRRARLTYLRKSDVQKRRKEDAGLMRKVEAEREAAKRAKEDAEQKEKEARASAEKAAAEKTAQERSDKLSEEAQDKTPAKEKQPGEA